jgi:hypothetical protein
LSLIISHRPCGNRQYGQKCVRSFLSHSNIMEPDLTSHERTVLLPQVPFLDPHQVSCFEQPAAHISRTSGWGFSAPAHFEKISHMALTLLVLLGLNPLLWNLGNFRLTPLLQSSALHRPGKSTLVWGSPLVTFAFALPSPAHVPNTETQENIAQNTNTAESGGPRSPTPLLSPLPRCLVPACLLSSSRLHHTAHS